MATESHTPTAAALQRRMELGLGVVRGVTLVWGAVVVAIDAASGELRHPAPALVVLVVLAGWSVTWTLAAARGERWLARSGVVVDLVLAAGTVVADQFVYEGVRAQSLASAWPLVAVLAVGVAAGSTPGLLGGLAVGAAGIAAAAWDADVSGRLLALCGATVLYGAAGWVAGWVATQLRTTAQVAASASARAEVARTLHDGVLQTLAVVQRRSDDPQLVALAREQDQELRAFLRGGTSGPIGGPAGAGLVDALGVALARVEARHGVATHLVVVDEGSASGPRADALVAACAEAATNAARHSGATTVWVSVDRREPAGTEVVVHDEGRGFDASSTPEGDGLTRSVRERLDEHGGGAVVRTAPGAGCDVTLWVP